VALEEGIKKSEEWLKKIKPLKNNEEKIPFKVL